jgi:DNA-binding NarL/FixJ family response regulator
MRILIVDRNAGVRNLLNMLLTSHGHEVFEAIGDNGGETARTSANAPEFVLIDLRLVLESGMQFQRESALAHVPTIAYTLLDDKGLIRRAHQAGLSVCLPLDPDTILDAISRVVKPV